MDKPAQPLFKNAPAGVKALADKAAKALRQQARAAWWAKNKPK